MKCAYHNSGLQWCSISNSSTCRITSKFFIKLSYNLTPTYISCSISPSSHSHCVPNEQITHNWSFVTVHLHDLVTQFFSFSLKRSLSSLYLSSLIHTFHEAFFFLQIKIIALISSCLVL